MMKKVTLIIMGLLVAAAIATTALAFGPGRGPGYGPGARGDFQGMRNLDLTADQMAKLKTLRETQFNETKPLRDKMIAQREVIRNLWVAPNPDQTKILAAQKEMNALRDQMQEKMTAHRLAAQKILTDEQKFKASLSAGGRGLGPMQGKSRGAGMIPGGKRGAGCPDCGQMGRGR